MAANHHPTWAQTFEDRSGLPHTSPLTSFLLRLIAYKKTNLCLSADVSTSAELIALADEVGDSICVFKIHADIVIDFNDRTVRRLRDLARRKKFLIFEDRKFGDIGSTVKKQYSSGPLRIAAWAELVNAHAFPGPAIIRALKESAESTIAAYNLTVHTEISGGSPGDTPSSSPSPSPTPERQHYAASAPVSAHPGAANAGAPTFDFMLPEQPGSSGKAPADRKMSIVNVHTTISMRSEALSPQPTLGLSALYANGSESDPTTREQHPPPFLRGLLLLAEMSTEGNLLTDQYTKKCVEMAREHRDFVTGFIAQRALNTEAGDNFLVMTPGVSLPPVGQEGKPLKGDGLGQQYRTPRNVILQDGCDVIIVGRGILSADDRVAEAERYRQEGWKAYQERVGKA